MLSNNVILREFISVVPCQSPAGYLELCSAQNGVNATVEEELMNMVLWEFSYSVYMMGIWFLLYSHT